jgi:hypothetical protein
MPEKNSYYVWKGHHLTKLEYFLLKEEIIADYKVDEHLEKSNYAEAQLVIDKIKKLSYNQDK